jgi:hypothetical protein
VQVEPIKTTLKVPRTQRFKLNIDKLLSNSAFEFNFRRYTLDPGMLPAIAAMVRRFKLKGIDTRVDSAWLQRLKLKCDVLISIFAFVSDLRLYTMERPVPYIAMHIRGRG